ncbi:YhjD/YihY/BrkB family envelope integrity protein [Natronococcus sp. A-GB1]|uniref:YihY/virulence factor BrkB family protein n=1 Tax=Natronococcus sp. A-GB1 TaxID=3037648 RepID=UPI00241EEBC7|nr:YhjD/YihY/BrkB family envelope integrity protein [Natronococcus sp. A-GB1]MDG5759481.1 YhjD/YihY/BrkB family envelope integrity protein [Natronococcus sp. A-GB1]
MSGDTQGAVPFAKSVVTGIQEKNVPFMAASIAYHAFISLIPLLVLLFFLVSLLGDEQLAADVAATTEDVLPESGQIMLEDALTESPATAGASIIGLVTLVWGSLKIFRGIDTAFSEIYGTTAESSLLGEVRDGIIVLGAITLALVAASAATIAFAILPDVPFLGLINPLLLIVGLSIAFMPMYYFFPKMEVTVREILPGVVVAAVGWAALQSLFQVYVSLAADSESAGAIGAILLLLTWLYFGGMILLVGAVVNATRSDEVALAEDDDELTVQKRKFDRSRRTNERLRSELEELRRERTKLRQDLEAHRSRRYDLEDRVDVLEDRTRTLEDENERLRAELEVREEPEWKQAVRAAASQVETINVGTVRDRRR